MPGGKAIRPATLTAASGKTVEIINTDAEGRPILGDALCTRSNSVRDASRGRRDPDGRLHRGARQVDIRSRHAGGAGGDDAAAATRAGDAAVAHRRRHRELPRSEIADLINSADRAAGAITAACFLREFVDDRPGALDIAGTAWQEDRKPYQQKGATGVAVRALVELAASI
jgi:leucyl aminopeptidase